MARIGFYRHNRKVFPWWWFLAHWVTSWAGLLESLVSALTLGLVWVNVEMDIWWWFTELSARRQREGER
jgi:hypothetical protein